MNYKQYREWVKQRLSTTKPYESYTSHNKVIPAHSIPLREVSEYDYYGSPESKTRWLEERNEARDRNK